MKGILNAIKFGLWAYKNPKTIQSHNFKVLSDMIGLLLKVASERRHMMTKICVVSPENDSDEICTVWVGSGISSDPIKRIGELIEENQLLKSELRDSSLKRSKTDNDGYRN